MSDEKIPRLFYWEEALDAWVPAPDNVNHIVDVSFLDLEEDWLVRFKRFDMTDDEFNSLPDDG